MAGIGKVGSFATVQAPKDPLLDTLQNIEQVGFQKRAEDRLIEGEKKVEQEKQLAEDVAWDGKFDPTIVGNDKIDDPMLAMSFKAKQEVGDIRKQLKNKSLPYEEQVRLNSKANKILQSFNVAKQTPEIILEKNKEIAKNVDKYDPDDISLLEGVSKQLVTGKYEAYYDDQGVGRVKIFKTDESGKPIGILKETTLANLANEFQPNLKSNYQNLLQEAVKNTAVAETEIQKGLTTTTNKGVAEKVREENAKAWGEFIANTSNEAYAISKRTGVDKNNKAEIAKIAAEEFKNALPSTYKVKTDLTEGRLRAEAAQKKKEDEATTEVVETPPAYSNVGIKSKPGYKTVSVVGGKPIQQIMGVKNGKTFEINTGFLNSYTVVDNPKTGGRSIAAEITYPDFKSSGLSKEEEADFKVRTKDASTKEALDLVLSKATKPISYKTEVVYLTEKDAAKYARGIGAKDVSDMANKAKVADIKTEKKPIQFDAQGNIIQ